MLFVAPAEVAFVFKAALLCNLRDALIGVDQHSLRNFQPVLSQILHGTHACNIFENTAEMMAQTTMNPSSRRLIKVMPEEAEKTSYYFEMLLGDALEARKEHIRECGHLYLDELDVM